MKDLLFDQLKELLDVVESLGEGEGHSYLVCVCVWEEVRMKLYKGNM